MCYNVKTNFFSGYDYEVIRAIEQILNFRINMTYLFGSEQWGTILPNGSTTAGLDVLRKGKADVGIGNYFLRLSRLKYFDSTVSYYSIPIALVIPPREIKLIFPIIFLNKVSSLLFQPKNSQPLRSFCVHSRK